MSKKLPAEICFARAEAYEECADHMLMDWSSDAIELASGRVLSARFRKKAKYYRALGRKRRNPHAPRA